MKKAFVICCNDSVEAVFDGDEEEAIKKAQQMGLDYYKNLRPTWNGRPISEEDYRRTFYWHVHDVPVIR